MSKQFFTNYSSEELQDLIQESISTELKKLSLITTQSSGLIKVKEACELLQVSKVTLYNWMKEGIINGYYLGTRLFFKQSELLDSLSMKGTKNEK